MGRTKCFKRNEVLEQAVLLFWKKGFAETTLSDLEKVTGVNKSGLYSEFKDKDDIFIEALKYYADHTIVLEILSRTPLGLENVECFLRAKITCSGLKGCFLASTLRELSVVPAKARKLIEQNVSKVREGLIANLTATHSKHDPATLADVILTFNTGMSLKLNAIKPEEALKEVQSFMLLIFDKS